MTPTFRLGIDIGGTNTVFGVVNPEGKIICKGGVSSRGHHDVECFIDSLYSAFTAACPAEIISGLTQIGVGAPNGNFLTGNIEFAPNLEWKGIIPLASLLNKKFSLPVSVSNDANAAAMGEMLYGAARGMRDFIMVTLGTGVGSGFVCNGKLILGHDGLAGELGHVIAVRDGRMCGCGRQGCLETYTSATGIVRTANEFIIKKESESPLKNMSPITAKDIHNAAIAGDDLALEIFDYTGKILGRTLADAAAITSPEAIILFGGLAQSGSNILTPVRKYFEESLLRIYQNKIKILPSMLNENDVAILGAAAL